MSKLMFRFLILMLFVIGLSVIFSCTGRAVEPLRKALEVKFSGKSAQIEVGGPYIGIEMHNSSPLINRISLFYPIANSVDLSTDYWLRSQFRVMFLGLKVGDKSKEWIGDEPFEYTLTPYSVAFQKSDEEKAVYITYDFCKDKPAMVARIVFENTSAQSKVFEVYTHLELSLRTCHTYSLIDKAWTEYGETGSTIYANYDNPQTGDVQVFITNVSEQPVSFTTDGEANGLPGTEDNWWMYKSSELPGDIIDEADQSRPVASYVYRKELLPGQKMYITQIIGSCKQGEGRELVKYLTNNYEKELADYEGYVLDKVYKEGLIETEYGSINHSVRWAKAILATNIHYLDGEFVPMPCPAEYNFYFTHDVLVTDLSAVNFDIERVRKDLEYIVKHANEEKVIPHAYYWKDERYVTEFAGSDNWNHFWFVILSAAYLRHSHDIPTVELLYPYIQNSIKQTLTNKMDDDLMWAYRPEGWDIGSSFGPRSYMTILAIRALKDYIFISAFLGKGLSDILEYERLTERMKEKLVEKLWDEDLKYLINYYEDGSLDPHIYIGSLLATHFNLIDENKKRILVNTAKEKLLDEKIGVYNVFPMDFHLLIDYLKFSGNEAGDPHVYANGGIWPNGNAWYALALLSIGNKEEALQFIENTMTVQGIINSPNGQPAMYEYRNSNNLDASQYGKIDKPQFMWAAGWYLYCLYNLMGIRENEWNVGFDPYLFEGKGESIYSVYLKGKPVEVTTCGFGKYIKSIRYDGREYPSSVVPEEIDNLSKIVFFIGAPEIPYIENTQSILVSSHFYEKERNLTVALKAFKNHQSEISVISPWEPKSVSSNEKKLNGEWFFEKVDGLFEIHIKFSHRQTVDSITVNFK